MPDIPVVTPTIKTFCTTREAATMLGVSVGTVQLWVESGLLNAWKTAGGHRRVMRDSVLGLLHKESGPGASQAAVPAPPVLAAPDEQRPRRLGVLVVEDDPVLLRLYEATIKKWPMAPELTLAPNGLTALLKLGSYSPDLLITDLNMSQLDGFEMLRVIRSTPSLDATTIVVVSGLDAAMIASRGGVPPGIEVLPKPIPFERLKAIAMSLVNERRLERRGA
jgi:excisionase family DNA binding protein